MKAKKAPSPTGKPSVVKPAAKKFLAGKKTAGKRASAYSDAAKKKKKGYTPPGGMVDKAAGAIAKRKRKIKKAAN